MREITSRVHPLLPALAVALCLCGACRKDSSPPPSAVSVEGVLPLTVSDATGDKTLLGPAASSDEPAKAAAGATPATEAPPITIDDTTAEGVVRAFVEMVSTGRLQQLPAIVMPEQQAVATEMADALQPLAAACAQLRAAMQSKFQTAPQIQTANPLVAVITTGWTVGPADTSNPDQTVVTLQQEGGGPATLAVPVKSVDGKFQVNLPNLPQAGAIEAMKPELTQLADHVRQVATRVESGEIADAQAAQAELNRPPGEATSPTPAPEGEAPAPAEPQAQPEPRSDTGNRPKSELEQQVDDAAGRAVHGVGL